MRFALAFLILAAALGCSGRQQKDEFKDLDRPKSALAPG
jgi:hypothetical protein